MTAPRRMPWFNGIAPWESELKTMPSAVSCAEVHPRYDSVTAMLVRTSTPLP
jgi:hypothetical protein